MGIERVMDRSLPLAKRVGEALEWTRWRGPRHAYAGLVEDESPFAELLAEVAAAGEVHETVCRWDWGDYGDEALTGCERVYEAGPVYVYCPSCGGRIVEVVDA